MIRSAAMTLKVQSPSGGQPAVITIQVGWHDPEQKLTRLHMQKAIAEGLQSFQTRMRLQPDKKFDVEALCQFFIDNKKAAPDRVMILDTTNGMGAEWTRPAQSIKDEDFDPAEFATRIKGYTDEQLTQVMALAMNNNHEDVVVLVTAEYERRKV